MRTSLIKPPLAFILSITFAAFLTVSVSAQDLKTEQDLKTDESSRELPASNPHALTGAWTVQSTVTNCNGTTLQNFSKLTAFSEGGTALETSTGLPPSQRTTAFGAWEHVYQNTFRYSLQFFRFAADGTYIGSTRANWMVTLGLFSNAYTADAQIQVILPNGTVVANLCGSETGMRFQLD